MAKVEQLQELSPHMSCTYWEAIMRVKPFYDKAIRQVKPGIEATLFLAYSRKSLKEVRDDLERGAP